MAKITTQRKKAFKWFSLYIRKKGASFQGYNRCVSCGAVKKWQDFDAGHFIHGVTKATYFEESNVHPQCRKCNTYLSGKLIEYTLYMLRTYSKEEIDRLRELSYKTKRWTIKELKEIEEKYKKKFYELE